MEEEITVVKSNGRKIRGRMYLPEGAEGKLPTVIFSHGFDSNFRELAHHGEGFAKAGIACFLFDFCGGGRESTSDGNMEEMTVGSECEDLKAVISAMRESDYTDPDRLFLQGESMGGLISALIAAECPDIVKALILWYPAFGIPEDARKRRESGEREIFGVRMNKAFDEEASDIDVYGRIAKYGGPVMMIHGDEDPIVPLCCSEDAEKIYENACLIVLPGAGHGFDGADSAAAREHSIAFIRKNM